MRTILLSAGIGSRLYPLTSFTPKCLMKVGAKPILGIWLEKLTQSNFGPFLVNTHYLSENVASFIKNGPYKDQVKIVYEEELLGTAGTLLKNLNFFSGDDGLLLHSDNYCLEDLSNLKIAHMSRPLHCEITMMTFKTDDPTSCGIIELNNQNVVINFHEKSKEQKGDLANCAVYMISPKGIDFISKNCQGASDFSNDIIPEFIGKIYTYETKKTFIDIGTLERYAKANSASSI